MAFPISRLPFYKPKLDAVRTFPQTLPTTQRLGTVSTRILLLSDTHCTPLFPPNDRSHAFKAPLPCADVVLHAGDLTNSGKEDQYEVTFKLLASIQAELKLVIAGNHDLTLDPDFWRSELATRHSKQHRTQRKTTARTTTTGSNTEQAEEDIRRAREFWTGEEAKRHGIHYLDEGVHDFVLQNGAKFTIYASPYSPEYWNWAFMYPRHEDRYTRLTQFHGHATDPAPTAAPAHPIPDHPAIDIVMTHGPPAQILDRTDRGHVGCEHLLGALARVRPRLHVFGHIHEDWGAMRVRWDSGPDSGTDVLANDPSGQRRATGECINLIQSPRTDTANEAAGDQDLEREFEAAWTMVIERGYVGLDITGRDRSTQWVPVTKGRMQKPVAEGRVPQERVANDGLCALPTLQWGLDTLCVNAAVMTGKFHPGHAPILIDLLLPASTE